MNLVKILIGLVILYLGQSYYLTRSSTVQKFIEQSQLTAMNDVSKACEEDYHDKVEAIINFDQPDGHWEMKGGKNELCDYMKQNTAMLKMTQGDVTWRYENWQVSSSFPWQSVTANYTEVVDINMPKVAKMSSISQDKIVLKRSLIGLKFIKIVSDGKMTVSH